MCLVQGHNTVTPVRLEPATPRSRLKHDFTEPLRFQGSVWGVGESGILLSLKYSHNTNKRVASAKMIPSTSHGSCIPFN